jgi:hypothetical protein
VKGPAPIGRDVANDTIMKCNEFDSPRPKPTTPADETDGVAWRVVLPGSDANIQKLLL